MSDLIIIEHLKNFSIEVKKLSSLEEWFDNREVIRTSSKRTSEIELINPKSIIFFYLVQTYSD
jgi:hypothetical protein